MVAIQLRQLSVPPGQSILLHEVSWEEFEAILIELGEHRATRLAYDNGILELMTPLPKHEYFKEVIGDAVKDIAVVLKRNYESYGSTTWRKRIQTAGIEPDNCFYFQNEAVVRGRLDVDLSKGDPPPDLVLEIDLTCTSLDRFPIYLRLEVPEIWRYREGILTIYLLQNGTYVESKNSLVFPTLPIRELPQLIEAHRTEGRLAIREAIQQWAIAAFI